MAQLFILKTIPKPPKRIHNLAEQRKIRVVKSIQARLDELNLSVVDLKFGKTLNVKIVAVKHLQHTPNFEIFITSKFTKNGYFTTKAEILKDGNIFVIADKNRASQIMQFMNGLSDLFKYGTMFLNTEKNTFQTQIATSCLESSKFNGTQKYILDKLILDIKEVLKYTQYNIYRLLYLATEVNENIFQILKQNCIKVRGLPQFSIQKMHQAINDLLCRSRNGKPLIKHDEIQEFNTYIAKPKSVDPNNQYAVRPDMGQYKKGQKTQETKDTISMSKNGKIFQVEPKTNIAIYEPLLRQFPFPNSPNQKVAIYSNIIFEKKKDNTDNINWAKFLSTKHTDISKGEGRFYFADFQQKKLIVQTQMIRKHLIKKDFKGERSQMKWMHQVKILQLFKNKTSVNIAKFYNICDREKQYKKSIVMDLYSQSSCEIYIRENAKVIGLRTKSFIIPAVIQGMRFLKGCNIVHLDMKFQNVLIGRGLISRLTDFGQSQLTNENIKNSGFTYPYTSPEYFKKKRAKFTMDVYSVGVMIDYMFTGQHILPYKKSQQARLVQVLYNNTNQYTKFMSFSPERYLNMFPQFISKIIWSLFLRCMSPFPQERPNQDILLIMFKLCQRYQEDLYV